MIAHFRKLHPTDFPWSYAMRLSSFDDGDFNQFLTSFKSAIPPRARKWQPSERVWWLRNDAIESAELLLLQHGVVVQIDNPPSYRQLCRVDALAMMHLTPDAPDFLIPVVYRALAKFYHPDTPTGGTAQMQRLNAAMEALK